MPAEIGKVNSVHIEPAHVVGLHVGCVHLGSRRPEAVPRSRDDMRGYGTAPGDPAELSLWQATGYRLG